MNSKEHSSPKLENFDKSAAGCSHKLSGNLTKIVLF